MLFQLYFTLKNCFIGISRHWQPVLRRNIIALTTWWSLTLVLSHELPKAKYGLMFFLLFEYLTPDEYLLNILFNHQNINLLSDLICSILGL